MTKKSNSSIKTFIDPTNFSDSEAALDLYGNMIRQSIEYDAFGGMTTFRARVLSIPIPMSSAGLRINRPLGPPPAPGAEFLSKKVAYAFRARIIDDPSPHWFIPDPCDTTYVGADVEAQKLVILHTKFIMMISDVSELPVVGDLVAVSLEKDTFSYNLQTGEALYKIQPSKTEVTIFGTACGGKCGGAPASVEVLPGTGPGRYEVTQRCHAGPDGTTSLDEMDKWFDELPSLEQVAPEPPPVVKAMLNMGYYVSGHPDDPNWPDAAELKGHVMVVGIRQTKQAPNRFTDRIQTIWYTDGRWHVLSSYGTTYSGNDYLTGNRSQVITDAAGETTGRKYLRGAAGLLNPAGTFVMDPGQYWDSHAWGTHKTYRTLVQKGDIVGHRENDLSAYIDDDPTPVPHTGHKMGINIHNSGNNRAIDKRIGPYSAGCQVFKIKDFWKQHMAAWQNATDSYQQERFTYTLLLEEEIPTDAQGLSGLDSVDFDAYVRWGWDRQAALKYVMAVEPAGIVSSIAQDLPRPSGTRVSPLIDPGLGEGALAEAPLEQEPVGVYTE